MERLVAALRVAARPRLEAGFGERQRVAGQLAQGALAGRRVEAEARRLGAHRLALLGRELAHQLPGAVERALVVVEPGPERGLRGDHRGIADIGAAHLQEALEAHLRKAVEAWLAQSDTVARSPGRAESRPAIRSRNEAPLTSW